MPSRRDMSALDTSERTKSSGESVIDFNALSLKASNSLVIFFAFFALIMCQIINTRSG